jgi:host factor-I protein
MPVMQKSYNLQDYFLNQARKEKIPMTVFLMNGVQMKGLIRGFDNFIVIIESDGKQQMVYKHAISTVIPMRHIDMSLLSKQDDEQSNG